MHSVYYSFITAIVMIPLAIIVILVVAIAIVALLVWHCHQRKTIR